MSGWVCVFERVPSCVEEAVVVDDAGGVGHHESGETKVPSAGSSSRALSYRRPVASRFWPVTVRSVWRSLVAARSVP